MVFSTYSIAFRLLICYVPPSKVVDFKFFSVVIYSVYLMRATFWFACEWEIICVSLFIIIIICCVHFFFKELRNIHCVRDSHWEIDFVYNFISEFLLYELKVKKCFHQHFYLKEFTQIGKYHKIIVQQKKKYHKIKILFMKK